MTFWSGERLEERLPELVVPYDASRVDCAAYRLCIGPEVYVSPTGEDDPNERTRNQLSARESFVVPAGQFGFLLTEEVVKVPTDAIAFISIRAKVKSRGLVNVSGFHVDPGYQGRLVFAVFNAGPAPVHLARGDDCFLIWYADLDRPSRHVKRGNGYDGIPSELINPIAGELQSFAGLLAKIKDSKEDADERLRKIERDHAILKWAIGIVAAVMAAWFGREFLPARTPPPVAPPALSGPSVPGAQVPR